MVTTHHCPKKYKGNCRKATKTPLKHKPYCPEHQTYCRGEGCDERVHLITEPCVKCAARQKQEEKRKMEEERKQKEREAAERKKKAMEQSERDRKAKTKTKK
jgi:hypothetical protein